MKIGDGKTTGFAGFIKNEERSVCVCGGVFTVTEPGPLRAEIIHVCRAKGTGDDVPICLARPAMCQTHTRPVDVIVFIAKCRHERRPVDRCLCPSVCWSSFFCFYFTTQKDNFNTRIEYRYRDGEN